MTTRSKRRRTLLCNDHHLDYQPDFGMTSTPLSNRSVPQGPSTVSRPVIIFVQNLSKRFHKVGWTWKGINYKVWDAFQKIADPQRLEEADPHWMSLTLSQLEYQQLKTGFPDLIHAYEETSPAPVVVLWEWVSAYLERLSPRTRAH